MFVAPLGREDAEKNLFPPNVAGAPWRRFFKLSRAGAARHYSFAVFLEALYLAQRLEIHLAISAVQIREFTRQTIAKKIARDFARFVNLGQSQARQSQSSWRF